MLLKHVFQIKLCMLYWFVASYEEGTLYHNTNVLFILDFLHQCLSGLMYTLVHNLLKMIDDFNQYVDMVEWEWYFVKHFVSCFLWTYRVYWKLFINFLFSTYHISRNLSTIPPVIYQIENNKDLKFSTSSF